MSSTKHIANIHHNGTHSLTSDAMNCSSHRKNEKSVAVTRESYTTGASPQPPILPLQREWKQQRLVHFPTTRWAPVRTKATSSEQPTGYHQFLSIKLSLVAGLPPQARLKHASCKASAHTELVRSSKRNVPCSGCHASSFHAPPTSRSPTHTVSVSKLFARVIAQYD